MSIHRTLFFYSEPPQEKRRDFRCWFKGNAMPRSGYQPTSFRCVVEEKKNLFGLFTYWVQVGMSIEKISISEPDENYINAAQRAVKNVLRVSQTHILLASEKNPLKME